MEAKIGRGRLPSSEASFYKDQSVLILNQNTTPCAAVKCDSLLPLFQKSLHVNCRQEQSVNRLPDNLASAPDLILVRPSASELAEELIQSCKEKWACASILVILCAKWERLLEGLPSVLTKADDFLACPFHESELLLRVRRLLQSNETIAVSSEKSRPNEPLHFGALVGQSESFVRAIKNIPPLAQSDATVLICGATGKTERAICRVIPLRPAGLRGCRQIASVDRG
jgi:DNA-binding NtrC family response regulator